MVHNGLTLYFVLSLPLTLDMFHHGKSRSVICNGAFTNKPLGWSFEFSPIGFLSNVRVVYLLASWPVVNHRYYLDLSQEGCVSLGQLASVG